MDTRILTILLNSRALARVLSWLFVFRATAPFAYTQSVTDLRGWMGALTVWLIRPDLLVRFGVASSHSACVSLCNSSFHIDWQREGEFGMFL